MLKCLPSLHFVLFAMRLHHFITAPIIILQDLSSDGVHSVAGWDQPSILAAFLKWQVRVNLSYQTYVADSLYAFCRQG
jgi:hypothetical protein